MKTYSYLMCVALFAFGVSEVRATPRRMSSSLPGGIVFPHYNDALTENASALVTERTRSLNVRYSPALKEDEPMQASGSVVTSSGAFGAGFGYYTTGGAQSTSGLQGAISARFGGVGLGFRVHEDDLARSNRSSLEMDGSFSFRSRRNLNLAAVYRSLGSRDQQFEAGVGYTEPDQYSIEADVLFPKSLASGDYRYSLTGALYRDDSWGVAYKMSLRTQNMSFAHSFSGMYWFDEIAQGLVEIEIPARVAVGVSLVF